ncbi:MAG: DoxX family protein [Bacteroidota bacterium]|nr:DoxX family protein [Bacteroidota bacterium]MDP4218081.1 DoxX family protein [Bacteroidota bacterium]MDP4245076.1 DoxX family protein [Bacteroidota bacterium]MDP4257308.1 DoxX family protein [Bacteroidota bacterium]
MSTFQNIARWGNEHHPRWFVFLRIALGLLLFAKGIAFMSNASLLDEIVYGTTNPTNDNSAWLRILITWANLLGGALLIIGMQTRLVCFLQLPILVGAILFINLHKNGVAFPSELWSALLTLAGLIFFIIEGGGPLSIDKYFYKNRDRRTAGQQLP